MPRATDIMPITAFTRAYQKVVKDLKKHGRPKVLTIDGRPVAIVQDPEAYDRMLDMIYVTQAVAAGLADDRPRISIAEARERIAAAAKRGWKSPSSPAGARNNPRRAA